ncbi:N-acetylmuramoyl-L-alanine amidase family protein [Psychroflexus planctonicus]|uniref:N-acetylmuramoyl-L-alanine amidase n=1 Tax=Psychroflexus planctonicus TaxID=1526575 RepID=A0ABQ1SCE4_9FLAO|nr:N-acetylmuramoyl-L-alanine amidase [Psychroflexus planctonicus]GGE27026.1 N-acetylmuramoyl-L-alanine amidase [Psychroflexus planctonicus]
MSKPKTPIIYKYEFPSLSLITNLKPNYFVFICLIILSFFKFNSLQAQNYSGKIKVVLDAGHGGKDPGTIGNWLQEKDIALATTLKIGALLEKSEDVEVVYTRTTDEFIGLKRRADIANKGRADLFVSIHCNGVSSSSPRGFETFVFGIARTKDNLNTARRENSAIYLEDDYEVTYNDYNPNSPESILTYTLVQEEYLDQSILLANYIQTNVISKLKQKDRGVKQDNFLVLRETYMPSILIELGFLTNKVDAAYLKEENGQNQMASQIVEAIIKFKKNINIIDVNEEVAAIRKEQEEAIEESIDDEIVFKVQVAAGSSKLEPIPENFNGLDNLSREYDGKYYRYYYKTTLDYLEAENNLKLVKGKGFKSAFIVAYDTELGKKISLSKALKAKLN